MQGGIPSRPQKAPITRSFFGFTPFFILIKSPHYQGNRDLLSISTNYLFRNNKKTCNSDRIIT